MRSFWGFQDFEDCDYGDQSDNPLFQRALKKFGRLGPGQMYGFSRSRMLDGKEVLANLEVVDLAIYHHIARQLQAPEIIRIET